MSYKKSLAVVPYVPPYTGSPKQHSSVDSQTHAGTAAQQVLVSGHSTYRSVPLANGRTGDFHEHNQTPSETARKEVLGSLQTHGVKLAEIQARHKKELAEKDRQIAQLQTQLAEKESLLNSINRLIIEQLGQNSATNSSSVGAGSTSSAPAGSVSKTVYNVVYRKGAVRMAERYPTPIDLTYVEFMRSGKMVGVSISEVLAPHWPKIARLCYLEQSDIVEIRERTPGEPVEQLMAFFDYLVERRREYRLTWFEILNKIVKIDEVRENVQVQDFAEYMGVRFMPRM